jgi:hypothetical protein
LDHGGLVRRRLLRDRVFGQELAIAVVIDFGHGQRRLIVRELAIGLVERCLIGTRIDLEQRLIRFYLVSLVEIDSGDAAIDQRRHIDRVDRQHGTERRHNLRHVARGGDCCSHWYQRRASSPSRAR